MYTNTVLTGFRGETERGNEPAVEDTGDNRAEIGSMRGNPDIQQNSRKTNGYSNCSTQIYHREANSGQKRGRDTKNWSRNPLDRPVFEEIICG